MQDTRFLRKLRHSNSPKLRYFLGDHEVSAAVGTELSLKFTGSIECVHCGRSIKKTFQQGYCYPCFQSLARCDSCIMKPELCHYHEGTCREAEWGEKHCLREHVVYLANTTGLKVGVTGAHKIHERWGDQGALAAILLAKTTERRDAGLIEHALKEHVNDRTDWRGLLKGVQHEVDLVAARKQLSEFVPPELRDCVVDFESEAQVHTFEYPVLEYLEKAKTINLDKEPSVHGRLHGIRGQYLFIDGRALNIRKYSGYEVQIKA